MRILTITNLYPRPGRETVATFNRQQVRALAAEHEVAVVAPVAWTDELRERPWNREARRRSHNDDGVEVSRPRYYFTPRVLRRHYGAFYLASIRREVERLVRTFRPEVVFSCFAHPDGWAAVRLAHQHGLPAVVKVIGSDLLVAAADPRRRSRITECLREAEGIVAVNRDLAEHAVRLGAASDRVHVVPEGLDTTLFHPGDALEARARLGLSVDEPLVLFVGNLLFSKGGGVLIEACALLAGRGVRFRCALVGRGRDEARLRTLAARQRLGEIVTFHGPRPLTELPDWYRAADVVALPSFSEGTPNVLREASACGRPFVATRVGGIPEITDPAVSRLVAPGAPVEVADALQELLARGPASSAMPARFPPLTWDESARQLADRLRAVVAEASRPVPRPILSSAP